MQVLYTHQKTKKRKTWQDGLLRVPATGRTATLLGGDNNSAVLDSIMLAPDAPVLKL
jgi:hypothetical protein